MKLKGYYMKPGDASDAVALAERLGISSAYEVV